MKTTLFTIATLALLSLSGTLSAQVQDTVTTSLDSIVPVQDSIKNDSIVSDEVIYKDYTLPDIFETDNTLKLVGKFIPLSWSAEFKNDTLTFFSISSIYKISDTIRTDTIQTGRKKFKDLPPLKADTARIKFRLEPLWSIYKVDDAFSKNTMVQAQIDKLPKKFKITHLIDFIQSDTFDIESPTLTSNEKKNIERYFEEKTKLESQLILMPAYHTTYYTLFLIDVFPEIKDIELYTPPGILQNMNDIFDAFNKYAGK